MSYQRPPLRLLRVVLMTALLLAAIAMLIPEEPHRVPESTSGKALATSEVSKAVH